MTEIKDIIETPWALMWVIAVVLFGACKWATLREVGRAGCGALSVGYLFGWVGMDAARFLRGTPPGRPLPREWGWGFAKLALGLLLVRPAAAIATTWSALLAAGVGMLGVVFILHFGLFHLLALAWREAGVDARPLMDRPALSRTLSEFWGRRWNAGFHRLAERYVFGRLVRTWGTSAALLATFLASGVVHELVITLPAGGGYGGPTAYFLLQGLGILAERRWRIGRTIWARPWTIALTLLPVGLLFPRVFLLRVVLPMLAAIHAL